MSDPIAQFHTWFEAASDSEPSLHTACALATSTSDGIPSVRMVLCKTVTEQGFFFYTNTRSQKGIELAQNPNAALVFHWKSLKRQVRAAGPVRPVDDATADAYFASRDRLSRIGAWASKQSEPLPSRLALEKAVAVQTARFGAGEVPRPEFWSGFCLVPRTIEFWAELPFRLHKRERFTRSEDGWTQELLFP